MQTTLNVITRKTYTGTYRAAVAEDSPMRSVIRVWCGDAYTTRGQARYAARKARDELRTRLAHGPAPHWR